MKAQASPNIALIKYWGKKPPHSQLDRNIGVNPSVSITLSRAKTQTEVKISPELKEDRFDFNSEEVTGPKLDKVSRHLDLLFDFLQKPRVSCHVRSENNFPTGAGIASSASGFAALTLATLAELEGAVAVEEKYLGRSRPELSRLSRLGSGSACRSVSGPFMFWEEQSAKLIGPEDWKLYDTIVFLDDQHKSTPSSLGHELALTSPLLPKRMKALEARIPALLKAIESKNFNALGSIIEEEAEEMHQIMESSNPPVFYRNQQTQAFLKALEALPNRDFFWTLDAGPNPHIISERPISSEIKALLDSLGIQAQVWEDHCGFGPTLLD
ncbi:diphosphomevalonate decarboxylase [bacterium]|nr:diphosphomevalonate decarboxylase [bacterium]